MQLDRKQAPAFREVEHVDLVKAQTHYLDNGLPVYTINAGEQELVRIEFIFDVISWDPQRPMQSSAVANMLNDGTSRMTGAEIARFVDYYGAFMQMEYTLDQSSLTLYTLNKHVDTLLPVIRDILTESIFPQQEIDTYKRNQQQKLIVSLEKNDVLSRRKLSQVLFGNTYYGYAPDPADYDRIEREDLTDHFRQVYRLSNCTFIVSGKITDGVLAALNKSFGPDSVGRAEEGHPHVEFRPSSGQTHFIDRPESVQTALRMGKVSVNRTHPDFPALQVLLTILGGYFGSRLMTNIREDKGYTYGIGAGLASLRRTGYIYIASEVGTDVTAAAISEIENEIICLREELIGEEELSLVRNYMTGAFLGDLENAFSHADKFKNIHFYGLGYDYYDTYIQTVRTIRPEALQRLALTHLDFNSFEKVVVGKLS